MKMCVDRVKVYYYAEKVVEIAKKRRGFVEKCNKSILKKCYELDGIQLF